MADTAMTVMGESNQEVAIILNDSNLFNGKALHIFGTYEEPLFVASELCDFIGVKNSPQALSVLRPEYCVSTRVPDRSGKVNNATLVTEAGMFKLVLKSRKKGIEPFQDWVYSVVLPTIRKSGSYSLKRKRDCGEFLTPINSHNSEATKRGSS